jgi:uncharacterized repeat protein (TIGR03803 family)
MKIKNFLLSVLSTSLGLLPAVQVVGQTFLPLYSFTAIDPIAGTNSDGANPQAGLVLSGNTLYGTTVSGGLGGVGTVFAVHIDGTGFTNLYSFTGLLDGGNPEAGLILSGNTLYGTAYNDGGFGAGTIFAIRTNGAFFTNLYNFTQLSGPPQTNSDGANPKAGLLLSGDTLYGTAYYGGVYGFGTIFSVKTNGSDFTNVYDFSGGLDGAHPQAGVILSGATLYTTTTAGSVFGVTTNYYATNSGPLAPLFLFGYSDGATPKDGLVLSGNTLYGTTSFGGTGTNGTVFALQTNGSFVSPIFTNLYNFTGGFDGGFPEAGLLLSDATLYGTAASGGSSGSGTVFSLQTNGASFSVLYSFTAVIGTLSANNDGASPEAGLILSGNTLYGTAFYGGKAGNGTVFSIMLPQLTIQLARPNVILTWPTNAVGLALQSTTNLSMATWSAVSPGPAVVNGQNTVTNFISATQQFYRLSQ